MTTYETPHTVRLDLGLAAGEIDLQTEERDTTTVDLEAISGDAQALIDAAELECSEEPGGHRVRVHVPGKKNRRNLFSRGGAVRIRIVAPTGASLEAATASAGIIVAGALGSVEVKTASGDIAALAATAETVRIKTASGDVRFGRSRSRADISSASGDITLTDTSGSAEAQTASGNVTVEHASGSLRASTMSGDVFAGGLSEGSVDARSMSGDVIMDVLPGVRVWMDLATMSGRAQSDLDPRDETTGDAQLRLKASTKTGDVRVRRSTVVAAG